MARYRVSHGDSSCGSAIRVISGEQGDISFRYLRRSLLFRERVDIRDAVGSPLASLRTRLVEFPLTFHLEIDGRPAARISRRPLSLRLVLEIALEAGDKWQLSGRWSSPSYTLVGHHGEIIAVVSRDRFTSEGSIIDVVDDLDAFLPLMVFVALDVCIARDQDIDTRDGF